MIRANIYSIETLPAEQRRAIDEGLDLLMGHMDEQVITKALRVRLPQDRYGRVSPERVGVSKLDKMVELHLMAVPFTYEKSWMGGIASYATGVSFVNTSHMTVAALASTTAHEGAHSLGFLRDNALQRDIHSKNHCCSKDCVMHKIRQPDPDPRSAQEDVRGASFINQVAKVFGGLSGPAESNIEIPDPGQNFCSPCQADLANFGSKHIASLRMARLAAGQVTRQPALIGQF